MMESFPKIFALGTRYVENIFNEEVEITEKVDGSQIGFRNDSKYGLITRSKGRIFEYPDKMFQQGYDAILEVYNSGGLPIDYSFYGEYLQSPYHNVLKYNNIPKNHIALFGVQDAEGNFLNHSDVSSIAKSIGFDVVPCIFNGKLDGYSAFDALLERESFLGGPKIEGVVVKNYHRPYLFSGAGKTYNIMCAKYVSEAFKEVLQKDWAPKFSNTNKWEAFKQQYQTEARWLKAVQHLEEQGKLLKEPKDIGPLIKEVYKDIQEEEELEIKQFLYNLYKDELLKKAVCGLPEWYKEKLVKDSIRGEG